MAAVFLITGRGGSLEHGLGAHLSSRFGAVTGISLSAEWLRQSHDDQIAAVMKCIAEAEAARAPLIANSYGAYLLLLALLGQPPIDTSVMLLSPVLGTTVVSGTYFRPPDARLFATAIEGALPKPRWLEIYMGEQDSGYMPDVWEKLIEALRPDRHVLFEGEGHTLSKELIEAQVGAFVERHKRKPERNGHYPCIPKYRD